MEKKEQTEAEIQREQQEWCKDTIINLHLLTKFVVNAQQWQELDNMKQVFEEILTTAYACKKAGRKMDVDFGSMKGMTWEPNYSIT